MFIQFRISWIDLLEKLKASYIPREIKTGTFFGCDVYWNESLGVTSCPRDETMLLLTLRTGKTRNINYSGSQGDNYNISDIK